MKFSILCLSFAYPGIASGFQGVSHFRAVDPSSLHEIQAVGLSLSADTVKSCDTGSPFRSLTKAAAAENSKKDPETNILKAGDALSADGLPIIKLTYLKTSGDSLYFGATVAKSEKETMVAGICVERRFIKNVFVEMKPKPGNESESGLHRHGGGEGRRHGGSF